MISCIFTSCVLFTRTARSCVHCECVCVCLLRRHLSDRRTNDRECQPLCFVMPANINTLRMYKGESIKCCFDIAARTHSCSSSHSNWLNGCCCCCCEMSLHLLKTCACSTLSHNSTIYSAINRSHLVAWHRVNVGVYLYFM